jgi:hypothetical protein
LFKLAIDSLIDGYKQSVKNEEVKITERYHESVESIVGPRPPPNQADKLNPSNVNYAVL